MESQSIQFVFYKDGQAMALTCVGCGQRGPRKSSLSSTYEYNCQALILFFTGKMNLRNLVTSEKKKKSQSLCLENIKMKHGIFVLVTALEEDVLQKEEAWLRRPFEEKHENCSGTKAVLILRHTYL